MEDFLHGDERRVYGDSVFASQKALIRQHAPHAKDFINQRIHKLGEVNEAERSRKRNKSRVPVRIKHVFALVKRLGDSTKVRN